MSGFRGMDRPDEHQISQDKIRLANGLWVARADWLTWREKIEDAIWASEYQEWHEVRGQEEVLGDSFS